MPGNHARRLSRLPKRRFYAISLQSSEKSATYSKNSPENLLKAARKHPKAPGRHTNRPAPVWHGSGAMLFSEFMFPYDYILRTAPIMTTALLPLSTIT